jgi:DNA-binding winged helix-turn-helix (wHTH) protein
VVHSFSAGFYLAVGENLQLRGQLRFGVFELDLRAGELRKHGLLVRLQEQPFQVLTMLLEQPGDVVTREELQRKLWPANTFVDFDHGLNKAISKIRDALGDSAESPASWKPLLGAATAF